MSRQVKREKRVPKSVWVNVRDGQAWCIAPYPRCSGSTRYVLPSPGGEIARLEKAVVKAAIKVSVFGGENYKGWGHALNELDDLVRAVARLELALRHDRKAR